ncbi:MAG: VanZ family protein [Alkaliphilus sp.]|nr:VanZ family protein [Alkaliphilus sp. AH-315-G20]MBN4067613.1 VanZ family protein [Alkaliphilus transvaalensis]PHS35975.1 MAG: VanZ family protein [Alkaliphilus sp.]
MTQIIRFVTNMLPYMLLSLPILLIVRVVLYSLKKREGVNTNWIHEIGVLFFCLYLVGLASQAVIPTRQFRIFPMSINLIPFNKIGETWQIAFLDGHINYLYIEVFGNIGLFILIGFMLPLLWKRYKNLKNTVLFCFLFSLFFEVSQLFLPRVTDVDDLIMNTFGGIVGYYLYFRLSVVLKKSKYKRIFVSRPRG